MIDFMVILFQVVINQYIKKNLQFIQLKIPKYVICISKLSLKEEYKQTKQKQEMNKENITSVNSNTNSRVQTLSASLAEKTSNLNININPVIYDKILQNQQELSNYLKYIRHKQPVPRIIVNTNFLKQHQSKKQLMNKSKKQSTEVRPYVEIYLKLINEVNSLESYLGNKIVKKVLQFLQEFPTMSFLFETINSFGKDKKKISHNKINILIHATDEMIPLFQKIIEKIESLKKQGESKKLLQLGHRIQHMQTLIDSAKNKIRIDTQNSKIFKTFDVDRVQKYLMMEESITKAEKNFGDFSQNFTKNKEVFSNLNKVYLSIKHAENPALI